MPYSNKQDRRTYWVKHYKKNAPYYRARRDKKRKEIKTYVEQQKIGKPCMDCKIIYPVYVMDYDHLDNKKYDVGSIHLRVSSLKTVQKEIDKCELVCSNCHRVRTYRRLKIRE